MEIEQNIFFDEFKNKLILLENSLIDVQSGDYDKEDINEIFRSIHTIKGTADLLGMFDVVSLTHKAEDLLQYVRDDKLTITIEFCQLFIELKKFISRVVDNISEGIFDDPQIEILSIFFEKEFKKWINLAENSEEIPLIKTILIIEDSALTRYTIKKIANDMGYHVLTSDNSEDGWQKIKEYAVDLLFCEFSEFDDDSVDLAELIRIDSSIKDLPIVMLVNEVNANINKIGRDISAKAWIKKPVEASKIEFVLKKIFMNN